jgi:hypothetical protein
MWHGLDECGGDKGFRTEHMKVVSGARKFEWSGPRHQKGREGRGSVIPECREGRDSAVLEWLRGKGVHGARKFEGRGSAVPEKLKNLRQYDFPV